jgi:hypothetical protein
MSPQVSTFSLQDQVDVIMFFVWSLQEESRMVLLRRKTGEACGEEGIIKPNVEITQENDVITKTDA